MRQVLVYIASAVLAPVVHVAKSVILLRLGHKGKSSATIDVASVNFDKLSMSTAQRVVRFWQAGEGQIH